MDPGSVFIGLFVVVSVFLLAYRAINVVESIKLHSLNNARELAKLQQQEVDKLLMAPRSEE